MQKIIFLILIMSLFVFVSGYPVFAQTGHMDHSQQAVDAVSHASKKVIDVGNKICPVSGERINEKRKATYEYKGKVYNFCCAMCIETFKKNPEKYIEKVDEELKAEQKNAPAASQAPGSSMPAGMHQDHRY